VSVWEEFFSVLYKEPRFLSVLYREFHHRRLCICLNGRGSGKGIVFKLVKEVCSVAWYWVIDIKVRIEVDLWPNFWGCLSVLACARFDIGGGLCFRLGLGRD
jgi:hypothetical protein